MFLKRRPNLLLIILLVIAGCNSAEITRLQSDNDSLRSQLHTQQATVEGLRKVTSWLDSIDMNRNLLVVNFITSQGHLEISARLHDIHHFVVRSGKEIEVLEQALQASAVESADYLALVKVLKREVQLRMKGLITLNELVARLRGENAGLKDMLEAEETDVIGLRREASAKDLEVLFFEARIQALVASFTRSEADAYYARAAAVEETAKRTRLAPRKRRETFREALELYKKALSHGKDSASANVARLEKFR